MKREMIKWKQQQKRRNRSGKKMHEAGKISTSNIFPGNNPYQKYEGNDKSFTWTGLQEVININIDFTKDNETCNIYGILLGKGNNSLDINVNVTHRAINTKSRIVLKGLLTEKSSIKFTGNTRIMQGAKGTNAWLECRLLTFSDYAIGQAIPSLEILENDVKAGHASTAGRINDLELFYLQSRGFSEKEARKLIAEGFLKSVLMEGDFGEAYLPVLQRHLEQLKYE